MRAAALAAGLAGLALCASQTDASCYAAGERSEGAAGFPAMEYKPCCDGQSAVGRDGDWGKFCPGGDAGGGGGGTCASLDTCGSDGDCSGALLCRQAGDGAMRCLTESEPG